MGPMCAARRDRPSERVMKNGQAKKIEGLAAGVALTLAGGALVQQLASVSPAFAQIQGSHGNIQRRENVDWNGKSEGKV